MIRRALVVVVLGLLIVSQVESQQIPAPPGAKPSFADAKQKYSYAFGVTIANDLKSNLKDKIDINLVLRGMHDAMSGAPIAMSDDEMKQVIQQYEQSLMDEQMKSMQAKNLQAGEAFMAENAKKDPSIATFPSGLQVKALKQGNGASPKATDTVTVNYSGKLIDGQEFANSQREGQPLTIRVDKVIPGWIEALPKMKIGDKWQLFIPAKLAYGEQGRPPVIPPNATLIFEIELLSIAAAQPQ